MPFKFIENKFFILAVRDSGSLPTVHVIRQTLVVDVHCSGDLEVEAVKHVLEFTLSTPKPSVDTIVGAIGPAFGLASTCDFLLSGPDASLFKIYSSSGILRTAQPLSAFSRRQFSLLVQLGSTQTINVFVNLPTDSSAANFFFEHLDAVVEVSESELVGTTVSTMNVVSRHSSRSLQLLIQLQAEISMEVSSSKQKQVL